ncbi:MAG: hypothetical protein JXI43_10820 [Tissierellales bacterium]|nr:hypothetical protein [Tissierellales bacterium]
MRVMGIDPAWAKEIAWAVAEGDHILKYGYWPEGKDLKREDVKIDADMIYIEDIYLKNFHTAKKLGMAIGKIMIVADTEDIPVNLVTNNDWCSSYKLSIFSNRNLRLSAMRNLVTSIIGKDLGEDLNAAVLIALYGARQERGDEVIENGI